MTLIETIIAIFIISGSIMLILRMVTTGMNANLRAEQSQQAALISTKQMETIREWAHTPANFYQPSWATVASGSPFADPDNPDYSVTIQAAKQTVLSPCTQDEQRYPAAQRRQLTSSYVKVVITVVWGSGGPLNQFQVASLIGAPEVPVDHLVVTPDTRVSPVSLNQNQLANITVSGVDSSGTVIPDLFFDWGLGPTSDQPSVGSIQNATRTGTQGQYDNFYMNQLVGGVSTPAFGPPGNVSITIKGRSPAIYSSSATQWLTNVTDIETMQNL